LGIFKQRGLCPQRFLRPFALGNILITDHHPRDGARFIPDGRTNIFHGKRSPVLAVKNLVLDPSCLAVPQRLVHGTFFNRINPENGLNLLLEAVAARARRHPIPYAHWYIDGGAEAPHDPALIGIFYESLEPARNLLLAKMQKQSDTPGSGPENLRTVMAALRPSDLHLDRTTPDPILARFQLKLLTEGSGTQIFSTTFAQWAARETLRRAQPLTLVVRFAPRQRQRPMNEMIAVSTQKAELDPAGSLLDADMGAYYNWINQQRLTGAEQSSFLAWFEDHNEAVAIGPGIPRGTVSNTPTDLKQILSWTV